MHARNNSGELETLPSPQSNTHLPEKPLFNIQIEMTAGEQRRKIVEMRDERLLRSFTQRVFGGAADEKEFFRLKLTLTQRGGQPIGGHDLAAVSEAEQVLERAVDVFFRVHATNYVRHFPRRGRWRVRGSCTMG